MQRRGGPGRRRRAGRVALALLPVLGACAPAPAARPDLLLVSVDTLRADALGAYGDARRLTPHLDRLAARSSVFERAYAPAPFTLPSVTALLTGRYPEEAGVRTNAAIASERLPTLATWLDAHGWQGAAWVGNFVLRRRTGLARGFHPYDDDFGPRGPGGAAPERDAAALSDAALAWLAARPVGGPPLFLWVHYQDPHGPYAPPPGYREPLLAGERRAPGGARRLPVGADDRGMGTIPRYQYREDEREVAYYRAGYAAEVRWVDEQIGRLLRETAPGGRLADAVVIFTADHGEALGERDQWFAHGELLSDAVLHVPLLIRAPGRPPQRRHDLASLLDLVPTALGLLGVPAPPGTRGRDLFAEAPGPAPELYASSLLESSRRRRALLDAAYRLELSPDGVGLYRLGDDVQNLARAEPEQVRAMRRRLEQLRGSLDTAPPQRRPPSDAERDALRALGYAAPGSP